jgi:hypothetical protein
MPFEEDEQPLAPATPKVGLKNVSSQKSIFDSIPKKPSPEDFDKKVKEIQDKNLGYKQKAAELAINFKKLMEDRTLVQNKNIFASELERELLSKMIQLAAEINNDPNEQEGMGSLGWITLLFKTMFSQRDRINQLEYRLFQLEKKLDPTNFTSLIEKELDVIDKKKKRE